MLLNAGNFTRHFYFKKVLYLILAPLKIVTMGRGDKKTKRGKIFKGSYGKHRLRTSRRLAAKRGKA